VPVNVSEQPPHFRSCEWRQDCIEYFSRHGF
jgi:hypothetical protein